MFEVMIAFRNLVLSVENFRKSLYNQKHAFYFRKVKQWMTCLSVSIHNRPEWLI